MNLVVDYDDTISRDERAFAEVIKTFRKFGHRVYIVTWRSESESNEIYINWGDKVDGIYPTDRKAKEKFMYEQGIRIDVWIDDNPRAILCDMEQY